MRSAAIPVPLRPAALSTTPSGCHAVRHAAGSTPAVLTSRASIGALDATLLQRVPRPLALLAELLPRHILTISLLSPLHCCSTLRFSFSISALAHHCIMQAAVPACQSPCSAARLPPAQSDMQFLGPSLLWESVTCCAHGVASQARGREPRCRTQQTNKMARLSGKLCGTAMK